MSEIKVNSILASATRLFAEKGVAGVSVQEIADHAGVAAGTVIYHFKTKNNLLFILARDILYRLCNEAESAVADAASPAEALDRLVESFFNFARDNRDRLVFLTKLAPFSTLDLALFPNADLALLKDKYIRIIEAPLRKAVQDNPGLNIAPDKTALAIWATFKGIAGLYCEDESLPDLSGEVKAMVAGRLYAAADRSGASSTCR
ncbi:MAG: TetR/AcrR family transcriptional regulator [Thermodesulfobacteriota bacterium]